MKKGKELKVKLKNHTTMEELTEIIGCFCSLICNPDDYSTGRIVCDYGRNVVVETANGNHIMVDRDEVLIYD